MSECEDYDNGVGSEFADRKPQSEQGAVTLDQGMCDYCGERPWTHNRIGEDVAPTDRGNEVRSMDLWLCDECDPEEKTRWSRERWQR
jgi:hypothetical protein